MKVEYRNTNNLHRFIKHCESREDFLIKADQELEKYYASRVILPTTEEFEKGGKCVEKDYYRCCEERRYIYANIKNSITRYKDYFSMTVEQPDTTGFTLMIRYFANKKEGELHYRAYVLNIFGMKYELQQSIKRATADVEQALQFAYGEDFEPTRAMEYCTQAIRSIDDALEDYYTANFYSPVEVAGRVDPDFIRTTEYWTKCIERAKQKCKTDII